MHLGLEIPARDKIDGEQLADEFGRLLEGRVQFNVDCCASDDYPVRYFVALNLTVPDVPAEDRDLAGRHLRVTLAN